MPDESFASIAEYAPALLWRGDENGRCVYLNKAQRDFWGLTKAEVETFTWASTLLPEDADKVFGPFGEGMKNRTGFRCEGRYRRADGAIRILETIAEPRFKPDGAFAGMVGVNVDVTDQRLAALELSESEARLRALADNLPYAMTFQVIASADQTQRRFSFVSSRCEALNGVKSDAAMADAAALYGLIHPEDLTGLWEAEQAALKSMSSFEHEVRMRRPDGETRWFSISAAPRPGKNGEIIWDGVQVDIQDRKRAEQRQRFLMNEMNHRVKNNLMTVLSIATQTSRAAPSAEAFRESFEARLIAMSKTHDILTHSGWESADLHEVLRVELEPYAAAVGSETALRLTGPSVQLSPNAAVSLSLVVHELATNAGKYGAFAAAGALALDWTVEDSPAGPLVRLNWHESGGPPMAKSRKPGFGSKLIQRLLQHDLGGAFDADFADGGLKARLTFLAGGLPS